MTEDEETEVKLIRAYFSAAGKRMRLVRGQGGTWTAVYFSAPPGVGVGSSQSVPSFDGATRPEAARAAWEHFEAQAGGSEPAE